MSNTRKIASAVLAIVTIGGSAAAGAQERRQAPPEIRTLLTEFVAAVNSGKPDEWETMAKKHFTESFLAKRDAAERRKLFDALRKDFGTITSDGRSGEDPTRRSR